MTSSAAEPRRSSKALSKAKFPPQKSSWSLFGGLLPIWSTTAFWIPVKPLYLRSTLSKSMRCTENCNTCSQHWWTEWAQFFSMTMPDCTLYNQHFKCWMNRSAKFCLICHFTWPLANCYYFFKPLDNFLQGKQSTNSRMQKTLCKNSSNPEAQIFMLQE